MGAPDARALRRDEPGELRVPHGRGLVPALVETVTTYATIGEICGTLREVFGEYQAVQAY